MYAPLFCLCQHAEITNDSSPVIVGRETALAHSSVATGCLGGCAGRAGRPSAVVRCQSYTVDTRLGAERMSHSRPRDRMGLALLPRQHRHTAGIALTHDIV